MNQVLLDRLTEEQKEVYFKYCMPDKLDGLTMESVLLSDENRYKINEC